MITGENVTTPSSADGEKDKGTPPEARLSLGQMGAVLVMSAAEYLMSLLVSMIKPSSPGTPDTQSAGGTKWRLRASLLAALLGILLLVMTGLAGYSEQCVYTFASVDSSTSELAIVRQCNVSVFVHLPTIPRG
jgi:hypothetical protein